MNDIFSSVDSVLTLPQVLERVKNQYEIGTIKTSVPILTGYQDCNIDVLAANGRFVVKIFSSEKAKKRIEEVVAEYTNLRKAGVPMPMLKKTLGGTKLLEISGKTLLFSLRIRLFCREKPYTSSNNRYGSRNDNPRRSKNSPIPKKNRTVL